MNDKTEFNHKDIVIQTIPMPKDTNSLGDIFGGWLVSQMDVGGAIMAFAHVKGKVVTVAIDNMTFKAPVKVGDLITCTATVEKTGNTSITIEVITWKRNLEQTTPVKVADGSFTYVAIDENGKPKTIT